MTAPALDERALASSWQERGWSSCELVCCLLCSGRCFCCNWAGRRTGASEAGADGQAEGRPSGPSGGRSESAARVCGSPAQTCKSRRARRRRIICGPAASAAWPSSRPTAPPMIDDRHSWRSLRASGRAHEMLRRRRMTRTSYRCRSLRCERASAMMIVRLAFDSKPPPAGHQSVSLTDSRPGSRHCCGAPAAPPDCVRGADSSRVKSRPDGRPAGAQSERPRHARAGYKS